jgi:superfamily I DNA/RNA helicase
MLLRLEPEQERHVDWALTGSGPVLLKGAPGTGKSIVAIYRVRSLINALRRMGIAEPRILFTSYTNALVGAARQMLEALLGRDAALVEVSTADMVISNLYAANDRKYKPIDSDMRRTHIYKAWDKLDQEAVYPIRNLPREYLVEEIDQVIVARDLAEELDYLTLPRSGRRIGLSEAQRSAVWKLYELSEEEALARNQHGYEQARRDALRGVRSGWIADRYDGVVIDEAQDLNPTVIRLLLELARSPDRLFLTADSNQCIYGNGFRWTDVHRDLNFRGRASTLRRNFRTTHQIVEAASTFLHGAEIDDGEPEEVTTHARSGPIPVALSVESDDDEILALADYLRESTRTLQVGFASCAVLVATEAIGQIIAAGLKAAGIPAAFMKGKALDLGRPVVKVTTFHSAKGLEFPVVAIAGLDKAPQLQTPADASPETEEQQMIWRRLLYVAMTRAMYALLVLLPDQAESPLLRGFSDGSWLREQPESWSDWLESVTANVADTVLAAAD